MRVRAHTRTCAPTQTPMQLGIEAAYVENKERCAEPGTETHGLVLRGQQLPRSVATVKAPLGKGREGLNEMLE